MQDFTNQDFDEGHVTSLTGLNPYYFASKMNKNILQTQKGLPRNRPILMSDASYNLARSQKGSNLEAFDMSKGKEEFQYQLVDYSTGIDSNGAVPISEDYQGSTMHLSSEFNSHPPMQFSTANME